MGVFNSIRKAFGRTDAVVQQAPIQFIGFELGGCHYTIDFNADDYVGRAYDSCGTLKTVVNRNALAMANGSWWISDKDTNDMADRYPDIMQRLAAPNPYQSFQEFIIELEVYRQLYGECYVYFAAAEGKGAQNAYAWWAIAPNRVTITSHRNKLAAERGDITYSIDGNVSIPEEKMLYIRDVNVDTNLWPAIDRKANRVYSVRNAINNLILAEEALFAINKDRGALGILSNSAEDAAGHIPMTDTEKEDIQSKFANAYGLAAGQWKVIVTDANLKWQPMTMSVKDLQLLEGMQKNEQSICDVFNYPYELLSDTRGVTYANKREAEKAMYEDFVIPMSRIYAEAFTRALQLKDAQFMIDFSHLSFMKAADKDKADAFAKNATAVLDLYQRGIISREEARLKLEYDEDIQGQTMFSEAGESGTGAQEAR